MTILIGPSENLKWSLCSFLQVSAGFGVFLLSLGELKPILSIAIVCDTIYL